MFNTGDDMSISKRDCPVKISLTPCSSYYLKVELEINGEQHSFLPSGAMSFFFSEFMGAVYALYFEERDCHNHPYIQNSSKRAKSTWGTKDPTLEEGEVRIESKVLWDEEGMLDTIRFCRVFSSRQSIPAGDEADPITVSITYEDHKDKSGTYTYVVDGRDLSYAIAKAACDAIKKYGFYGYYYSTGFDVVQSDLIDINQLLFFKSYAMDAMDTRILNEEGYVYASSFEKEIKLLMLDM